MSSRSGRIDKESALRTTAGGLVSRRSVLGAAAGVASSLVVGGSLTPTIAQAADAVILAMNGEAKAVIVTPASPDTFESTAAAELQSHVERITGARLEILTDGSGREELKIYIGRACPDSASGETGRMEGNGDSFGLRITRDAIQLACLPGGRGVMYAAYELLEQSGVRWLMPGPHGTSFPTVPIVRAELQDRVEVPAYSGRDIAPVRYIGTMPEGVDPLEAADWSRRRRFAPPQLGQHGIPLSPPANRQSDPDLFMRVDGIVTNKLNVAHPEVLARAIRAAREALSKAPDTRYLNMGPTDGLGFGVSEWDADDLDPLTGSRSVTDRYVKFFNLILEDLEPDYPTVGIAFYAYSVHERPPVREKPHPRLLPVFAPIAIDRLHSASDPAGNERRYFLRMVEGWRALGVEWAYRGYVFNLADPGMPFSALDQIAQEWPRFAELGATAAFRVEGLHSWGHDAPGYYLASKLMWNPRTPPAPIVEEFFRTAYGPAAGSMRGYFSRLQGAFSRSDLKTGNMYDFPDILDATVLSELDAELAAAETAGRSHASVSARVAIVRKAFDYGAELLAAIAAWRRFEFTEAKLRYSRAWQRANEAISTQPVAVYPFRVGYLTRFWDRQINEAAERSSGGNDIVARAPDRWRTILDSHDKAEADEVWASDVDTSTWLPLDTVSKTWSGQGLRYYKGSVWYRTDLHVPSTYQGRSIRLWIGAIDEFARAWINGHELTRVGTGGALHPWEFDATKFITFGATNQVTVLVTNRVLDELGTGGIMGPTFLWAGGPTTLPSGSPEPRTRTIHPSVPISPKLQDRPSKAQWMKSLPDIWSAHIAQHGAVADLGLWEPELPTTSWLQIRTRDLSPSQQGFSYYRGGIAYRTSVALPRGRHANARLWIAAIDGTPTAWFDGQPLAVAREGSNASPWEFHLPQHVMSREPSVTIAVEPDSHDTNTPAGIYGPSFIYQLG